MTGPISPRQFHEAEGAQDWLVLSDGACAYARNRIARGRRDLGAWRGTLERQPDE